MKLLRWVVLCLSLAAFVHAQPVWGTPASLQPDVPRWAIPIDVIGWVRVSPSGILYVWDAEGNRLNIFKPDGSLGITHDLTLHRAIIGEYISIPVDFVPIEDRYIVIFNNYRLIRYDLDTQQARQLPVEIEDSRLETCAPPPGPRFSNTMDQVGLGELLLICSLGSNWSYSVHIFNLATETIEQTIAVGQGSPGSYPPWVWLEGGRDGSIYFSGVSSSLPAIINIVPDWNTVPIGTRVIVKYSPQEERWSAIVLEPADFLRADIPYDLEYGSFAAVVEVNTLGEIYYWANTRDETELGVYYYDTIKIDPMGNVIARLTEQDIPELIPLDIYGDDMIILFNPRQGFLSITTMPMPTPSANGAD